MKPENDLFPDSCMESPMSAFRARHGIWTHYSNHMDDDIKWSAMSMGVALAGLLKMGYEVELEERVDEVTLLSHYASVLDSHDLITYGNTERDAVFQFAIVHKLEGWQKVVWG